MAARDDPFRSLMISSSEGGFGVACSCVHVYNVCNGTRTAYILRSCLGMYMRTQKYNTGQHVHMHLTLTFGGSAVWDAFLAAFSLASFLACFMAFLAWRACCSFEFLDVFGAGRRFFPLVLLRIRGPAGASDSESSTSEPESPETYSHRYGGVEPCFLVLGCMLGEDWLIHTSSLVPLM